MKIQYGFAKLLLRIKYEKDLIGNVGDIIMFCRHEKDMIFWILDETLESNKFGIEVSSKGFNSDDFKVVNNIYLLCTNSLNDYYIHFEKDLVYHFDGKIFRSLFPIQPYNDTSRQSLNIGEYWKTTNFFLSGKWMSILNFKVISKQEALEYKEIKESSEKFGI